MWIIPVLQLVMPTEVTLQSDQGLQLCGWGLQKEKMLFTGLDHKSSHKHLHDHSLTDQVVRRCLKLLIAWPILHQPKVTCNLRFLLLFRVYLRMGRFEGCRSVFFLCQGLTIMLTWMPTVEAASFFSLLYLIVNINLKGIPKTLQRWIKTEQWWSCFAKRLSVIIILSGRSAGAAVGNTDYWGKRWQMLNV